MFLTTNRVGNIDRAFKSRIHVALYYPKLDKHSTYEIWKTNIRRIKADFERDKRDFRIERSAILRYSKEHFDMLKAAKLLNWNGRQIRNAFQTAIALAEYDARTGETPVLDRKQFEIIATASRDFDQYLKDTQKGKDDDELAYEENSRVQQAWGKQSQNLRNTDEDTARAQPTRTVRHTSTLSAIQRRNSALAGKRKAKQEEVIVEEQTDDTFSVTDGDEVESEAEASVDSS